MKRYNILFLFFTLVVAGAQAQTGSISRVLQSVEQNNKELKANSQLTVSRKLEARTENTLSDPTVSLERLYGSPEEIGKNAELTVSQSFDFPTVYADRAKINKLKFQSYDKQDALFRQELLLRAKEVCLDLVLLNQQKDLLERRERNAKLLSESYARRLETGEATILEVNKIELELLNIKTEVRMNEADRLSRLRELTALNGDVPLEFSDIEYEQPAVLPPFEDITSFALSSDLRLRTLESERDIARKGIGLSRSSWFPKIELGYRRDMGKGELFNGFIVGVSVPLWEKRNTVKKAKAETHYAEMQLESTSLQTVAELRGLYDQIEGLKASLAEYGKVFNPMENISLLDRALAAGQLSTIDYFVELTTINQSMQNYLQLQNQYQKLLARIYKYRL